MSAVLSETRRSPIDEILAKRAENGSMSRYGGEGRQHQEREDVRETYLAVDVHLASGECVGLFYYDLAGSPRLSSDQTMLTVPFKEQKLLIRGYRLFETYRAILHHSLDILEESHRPQFNSEDDKPVIESIEVIENGEEQ